MSNFEFTPDTVLTAFEKSELLERALDLACRSFENPTDEHIDWIANRLGWNHLWGTGEDGAVTIH